MTSHKKSVCKNCGGTYAQHKGIAKICLYNRLYSFEPILGAKRPTKAEQSSIDSRVEEAYHEGYGEGYQDRDYGLKADSDKAWAESSFMGGDPKPGRKIAPAEEARPMKLRAEINGKYLDSVSFWCPKNDGREAYLGSLGNGSVTHERAKEIAYRINTFEGAHPNAGEG